MPGNLGAPGPGQRHPRDATRLPRMVISHARSSARWSRIRRAGDAVRRSRDRQWAGKRRQASDGASRPGPGAGVRPVGCLTRRAPRMQPAYRYWRGRACGHPHDVGGYVTRRTPWRRVRGDNEQVSEDARRPARARLSRALAFVRSAEPRMPLSRRAVLTDIAIAALVLVVSLLIAKFSRWPGHLVLDPGTGSMIITPGRVLSIGDLVEHELVPILLLSVPLAARRRFPLTAFGVLVLGAVATSQYATDITFLAIVFAGYSAVAYSRFRNAALLSMPLAGVIVAAAFWTATPATSAGSAIPDEALAVPQPPLFTVPYSWRLPGLLVAAALVLIAVVANAMQARDRIRLLRAEQAEQEAATRRALALERARLA